MAAITPHTASSLQYNLAYEKDVEGAGGFSDVSKDSVHSDAPSDKLVFDWTDAEERKVVRKLDLVVLLLLFFGFVSFQLERNNIANAVSSTLFKDVGITQNQYNTGQGLLYLGIILFEIPSQMLIQKLGPQRWLTAQVFAFGLVATLQMFMHNYGSFLATRIVLGIVECGYIPGALYTLSTFYKRTELGSRTSFFYLGNVIVIGIGGLMAAGIFRIKNDLRPWQNLFLIEGCVAIFCATVFLVFLPDSPQNPLPLLGRSFSPFTQREREIIYARVILDDPRKAGPRTPLTGEEIMDTLTNWRNYPHILHIVACVTASSAMTQYAPLLIKGFGFDTIRANALSSVGGWIAVLVMASSGLLSDKLRSKGPLVIALTTCSLVMWIAFQSMSRTPNKWGKYATMALTTGFALTWHPLNATWLSLNQRTPQHRAVAMAMFAMASNVGALCGSQLLRANDAPKYPIGFRVGVGLVAFGTGVAVLQHVQYRWSNRQNSAQVARGEELRTDRPEVYVQ
ncbi:hypothetical protein CspHIS471_0100710 [Cutaneotrichosporon sp. HIS471]|nr:hypothetical protein CspHIS471_0100710 [Cutaneotrichosporon sp. HIS471]